MKLLHCLMLAVLATPSQFVLAQTPAKKPNQATPPATVSPADKKSGKLALTPKGGQAASAAADDVPGGMPQSFVIPHNTCEQGSSLQKLFRDIKK